MHHPASSLVLLAGLVALLIGRRSVAADLNKEVNDPMTAPSVVNSVTEDLSYDENQRLASHQFLYPVGSQCVDKMLAGIGKTALVGFEVHPVAGEALKELFPNIDGGSGGCHALCMERGVEKSVAGAVMPERQYHHESDDVSMTHKKLKDWFWAECKRVEVCFLNYYSKDFPINVYWLPETGEKKVQKEGLLFGERKAFCFNSLIGHKFQAEDGETGEIIETVTIEFTTIKAFGESPVSDVRPPDHDYEREIANTLNHEWDKHHWIKRTFSPLGFRKGRLPNDLFASMGALQYNNRFNKVREEWKGKGLFVNWWETDVYFIQIPWKLKEIYQKRLLLLVEAWAGEPLEQTSLYGLRQYETGARLLTHVDRHQTHAVSLIVNVAQGNLIEPWTVEVQDHADRLHEIPMEPGDVVYYESAKNLHARNMPLTGENAYYTNVFTHYRPKGDPDWYLKPNPDYTPEPVVEVKGECHPPSKEEMIGRGVGQVKCDDARLGQYISPSLFQATTKEDLFAWWQQSRSYCASGETGEECLASYTV